MLSTFSKFVAISLLCIAVSACAPDKKLTLSHADVGSFSFPADRSYSNGKKIDLYGTLEFPEGAAGKVPAMVILHGSAGQGYRDSTWSKFFLANGVATFQVDWLSPRGQSRGGPGTPKNPYDLTAAVKFLATHPRIDATRIGTIGFSRGGSIMMSTLQMREYEFGGHKPVLNVNLYGNCIQGIDRDTTNAPVLVIVGDRDPLTTIANCETLIEDSEKFKKDFRLHIMKGGTHAFDDNLGGTVYWGNKPVTITPSPRLTAEARAIVLEAMNGTLK